MADPATPSPTTPQAFQWYRRPGATIEFNAATPQEAAGLEMRYRDNAKDPALQGRFRVIEAPPQASPSAAPGSEPDIIGRLKAHLTAEPPEGSPRQNAIASGIRTLGNFVLPGSIPEAAVQAAIGPAAKAGAAVSGALSAAPSIVRGLAGAATRVAVPAAIGAGAAAATGEDVAAGAETGAMAGGIGEAGRAVGAAAQFALRFGHLNTQAFQARVRNVLGPKLGDAIEQDIPSLASAKKLTNTSDVLMLSTEEGGRKILGKMFDTVESTITTRLKGTPIEIPAEAYAAARGLKAANLPPGAPTVPVDAAEAITLAKQLRAKALRGKQDAIGYEARQLADSVQGALETALTAKDANLAARYAQLRGDYGKYMDLRDFIRDAPSDLFPATPSGGPTIDLVKFHERLIDNLSEMAPERFPMLHKFFAGSEAIGTGPTKGTVPVVGRAAESVPLPGGARFYGHPGRAETIRLPEAQQLTSPVVTTLRGAAKNAAPVGEAAARAAVPTLERMLSGESF